MVLPLGVNVTFCPAESVTVSVSPLMLLTTWPLAIFAAVTALSCKLAVVIEPSATEFASVAVPAVVAELAKIAEATAPAIFEPLTETILESVTVEF